MSDKASRSRNAAINLAILLLGIVGAGLLASGVLRGCSTPVNPQRASNSGGLVGEVIQIEVLNGCGHDGLASAVQQYLRDRGFDVVATGNFEAFGVEESAVVDRIGDMKSAHEVAKALGLDPEGVTSNPDIGLYLDATVVVGCDYESIPPFSLKQD